MLEEGCGSGGGQFDSGAGHGFWEEDTQFGDCDPDFDFTRKIFGMRAVAVAENLWQNPNATLFEARLGGHGFSRAALTFKNDRALALVKADA